MLKPNDEMANAYDLGYNRHLIQRAVVMFQILLKVSQWHQIQKKRFEGIYSYNALTF